MAAGYGAPQGYGMQGPPGMPPQGMDPQIMTWFQTVDTDRTGKINALELQQALTNANWSHFNAETCRLMIGMFDTDHSGQIDCNEFQALWSYIHQWKNVFDRYDRDRSGAIDANELSTAWNEMGYRLQPQLCSLVIYKFDLSGQRPPKLSLDSFIQASVLLKSVTDQFRMRDRNMSGVIQASYEDFMTMCLLNKH